LTRPVRRISVSTRSASIRAIVGHAPELSARAAALLADVERRPGTYEYDQVRAALQAALPEMTERSRRRCCRDYWRARYRSWVEHRLLENLSGPGLRRYIAERVAVEGREHLDAALRSPGPVVAFTPHFGSFLVTTLRVALEALGHKQLFLFYDPPEMNHYSTTMRNLFDRLAVGAESVFNNRAGLLKVSKGLARGGVLGIMPDVYRREPTALFVPFLGRLQMFMAGTAYFALRYRAPLLPLYGRPIGGGRFSLVADPPLKPAGEGPTAAALFETTAAIAQNMEMHILRTPEQWVYWPRFGIESARAVALPGTPEGWEAAMAGLRERLRVRASPLSAVLTRLETELAGRRPT
jgi:Kdo2-lipid IVA lauroyltransferase/acyltransferase